MGRFSIHLSVPPPLGHPASPEAQPARPEASGLASWASGLDGWASGLARWPRGEHELMDRWTNEWKISFYRTLSPIGTAAQKAKFLVVLNKFFYLGSGHPLILLLIRMQLI